MKVANHQRGRSSAPEFPEGSVWRKWDLHIHSPATILNNQYPKLADGSPDWDQFVSKLENLDIAVLGITDYFSIEGYKKIREYKAAGRLPSIHTILPNIEFRLDKLLATKKDGKNPRRLNFHVIFSDQLDPKDIEEHFLNNIEFFHEGTPQGDDWKEKLKLSNLEALGRKLKEQHAPFRDSGDSDLKIGAGQAVVTHEGITDALRRSQRFRGKYLLVFPEELSNLISWDGQDHLTRKGLLQKSDMVFSGRKESIQWCLGRPPYAEGPSKFVEEFKSLKPCIHGSDAHKLEEIAHPCTRRGDANHDCVRDRDQCNLRFCWIKADPTFEGLRQLLYEPADRVSIQQEDPSPLRSGFSISAISLSDTRINPDLYVAGTEIPLNTGLVAVTGAKGGGKTALVDLIANCYLDRSSTDDHNSFVWRIAEDRPPLETTLSFKGGSRFSKKVLDGTYFEDSELVYIAQGELAHYIEDRVNFEQHVRGLILENPDIKNSAKSFEFNELRDRLESTHQEISRNNKYIADLEAKTNPDVLEKIALQKKQAEADLKDIESRIAAVHKSLNPERLQQAQDKQRALESLKGKRDSLVALQGNLATAMRFVDTDIPGFNELLGTIRDLFVKVCVSETLDDLTYRDRSKLEAQHKAATLNLKTVVVQIEEAQKSLVQYSAEVRDHAKLLGRKAELERSLGTLKKQEELFVANRKILDKLLVERKKHLGEQIQIVLAEAQKYQELIGLFSNQKPEILGDLTFEAQVMFDKQRALKAAEDVLDNRKVTVFEGEESKSEFENLLTIAASVGKGNTGSVEAYISELERLNGHCKTRLKRSQAVSVSDFYDALYADYFELSAVVKYKGTELRKLSLGQKATVLMKVHLAQGDKPIVIDSHDEHLDNESIMDELVKALRHAKRYRQIILVSNNGNVVINSDAEQIIVARSEAGKISYRSGSTEDTQIRDIAIKVLEGGEEAFTQRQQKYRVGNQ